MTVQGMESAMAHTVEIIGKPMGQPRQRHAFIGGRVRNYTPEDAPINAFKTELKTAWTAERILGEPCYCHITAIFPRPKAKTSKRRPNPRLPHTSKPDCDNIAKGICDALNIVAWHDDSQVAQLKVVKLIGTPDEQARTIVTIGRLSELESQ